MMLAASGVKGLDAPKQEWRRLSPKSKRAIQQWVTGLMILSLCFGFPNWSTWTQKQ